MNFQLGKHTYLAGEHYSVADMASFPWILPYKRYGFDLTVFPNLKRWFDELKQRPLLRKGVDIGKEWRPQAGPDDKIRDILFNQTSAIYRDR